MPNILVLQNLEPNILVLQILEPQLPNTSKYSTIFYYVNVRIKFLKLTQSQALLNLVPNILVLQNLVPPLASTSQKFVQFSSTSTF